MAQFLPLRILHFEIFGIGLSSGAEEFEIHIFDVVFCPHAASWLQHLHLFKRINLHLFERLLELFQRLL